MLKWHETSLLEEFIHILEAIFDVNWLLGGSLFHSTSTNIKINSIVKIIKESLVKRTKGYFKIDEFYAASNLDPCFISFKYFV